MTHILVLLSCASFLGLLPVSLLAERLGSSWQTGFFQSAAGLFSSAPPTAFAACGDLQGIWEQNVAAFRGIPYGTPPVGSRRFQPADPAPCWPAGTVFDASKNGNICFQSKGGGPGESEDCLNLNVFAPAKARNLPVFVWIYGGSNVQGSAISEFYGPIENIVRRHPCVLVAMNYRTGTLGYLALKELSTVDPRGVSGNAGIADQQLALRWVQENIHAFGGDAKRVAIIGQSSGGTNVLGHLASSSSRGLFGSAIALSPSANITMDRATKEAQDAKVILPRTPCANVSKSALLDCLFSVDAGLLDAALDPSYSLFDALYDYPTNHQGISSRMSALVFVDGSTITSPLLDALESGLHDVPLLVQSAQAELAVSPAPELENISRKNLSSFLHRKFDPSYGPKTTEEIWKLYEHYQPPEYAAYALDSDSGMACGLRRLAMAARSGFRQPVYWTTVTGAPSGIMPQIRQMPFHNWDFLAAVGNFANYGYKPSPRDEAFGERLLDDWFQLLSKGSLTEERGYRKVQDMQGQNVIGSTVGSTKTDWHLNHKLEVCTFWESIGVDQRWWWIN